jgi:ketosteroid isomerase-like protein
MTITPTDAGAVLRAMYAAEMDYLAAGGPGTASFDTLAPYFSPKVVLYQADSLPYGGVWRGHDGIEQFFLAMSETWSGFEIIEQEFVSTGTPAAVLTQVHAQSRSTGEEIDFPILQIIRFANGRITEVRPFYWDTAAINAACTI